jgi:hypothetical protein
VNNSDFRVLFDITNTGYRVWAPLCCLVVIAALLPIFLLIVRKTILLCRRDFLKATAVITVVCLLSLIISVSDIRTYLGYKQLLLSGQASYVEGPISGIQSHNYYYSKDFFPYHDLSFMVNGVYFRSASNYRLTSLNIATLPDGQIEEGDYARIWYVQNGNAILKMEVKH